MKGEDKYLQRVQIERMHLIILYFSLQLKLIIYMILRMIQLEGYHQWSYLNIWCWLSFSCTILTVSQTQNLFLTQGFFKKNKFIYLFIFGCIVFSLLRADFSVVVASGGYSSLWCTGFSLQWLLIAEHGLYVHRLQQLWHVGSVVVAHGLSSCGTRASLLHGMWDLPGPGLEPVSPALAGGFSTTVPPGKSLTQGFYTWSSLCLETHPAPTFYLQYVSWPIILHPLDLSLHVISSDRDFPCSFYMKQPPLSCLCSCYSITSPFISFMALNLLVLFFLSCLSFLLEGKFHDVFHSGGLCLWVTIVCIISTVPGTQ